MIGYLIVSAFFASSLIASIFAISFVAFYIRYRVSPLRRMPSDPIGYICFGEIATAIDRKLRIFGTQSDHMARLKNLGPIRRINLFRGISRVEISDPALVKKVFSNSVKFPRGQNCTLEPLEMLVGSQSILLSAGDIHKQMRRYCSSWFTTKMVRQNYLPIMRRKCRQISDKWMTDFHECNVISPKYFDITIAEDLGIAMLEIMLYILTGRDFQDSKVPEEIEIIKLIRSFNRSDQPKLTLIQAMPWARQFFLAYRAFMQSTKIPTWVKTLGPASLGNGFRAVELVDFLIENQESLQKQVGPERNQKNLLEDMLLHRAAHSCTTEDVNSLLLSLIFAGHDTTANAIMWTLKLLSENQECQKQCQHEVDDYLRNNNGIPWDGDHEESGQFDYLNSCIRESLRLYPVVPFTLRVSPDQGAKLGEYPLPKGTEILTVLAEMHRNPKTWGNDSNLFRPERFSPSSAILSAFRPFGDGTHMCVGNQMAMIQMKIFLLEFLRRFNFHPMPGFECHEQAMVTLTTDRPMKLRIEIRMGHN